MLPCGPCQDEVNTPDDTPVGINAVLLKMKQHLGSSRSSSVMGPLASKLGVSDATLLRHMQATAETCFQGQMENVITVCKWAQTLKDDLEAHTLVQWQSYDETPLRLRVSFGGQASPQLSKVLVIEQKWVMLFRRRNPDQVDAPTWFLLQGSFSPTLRPTDSTAGLTISAALQSSQMIPDDFVSTFQYHTRVAETDEAPSNAVAERLTGTLPGASKNAIHWRCSAHKAHAIAEKTWQLAVPCLSGSCAAILTIQNSQNLGRLRAALELLIRKRVVILKPQAVSVEAEAHRANIIKTFCPPAKNAKKRATVLLLSAVFNGDWRSGDIQHICDGCCNGKATVVAKMSLVVGRLLQSVRPSKLNRGNWLEWPPCICSGWAAIRDTWNDGISVRHRIQTSVQRSTKACRAKRTLARGEMCRLVKLLQMNTSLGSPCVLLRAKQVSSLRCQGVLEVQAPISNCSYSKARIFIP